MRKIEVCCTSVADALQAREGGAARIELCSALGCGGVTPSYGLAASVVAAVGGGGGFGVNVLVRPSEGAFCYGNAEVKTMAEDIRMLRRLGADGVVFGALTPDGDVDIEACRVMAEAADGMNMTFHRAFDQCRNPFVALEQIISLGVDHILTSGQEPSALSGAGLIADLVRKSAGRIVIMPGCGIKPSNIAEIERLTGAQEFHASARRPVPDMNRHHVPKLGFENDSTGEGLVYRTCADVVRALASSIAKDVL